MSFVTFYFHLKIQYWAIKLGSKMYKQKMQVWSYLCITQ